MVIASPPALQELIDEVYGPIAPAPVEVTTRLLHRAEVTRWSAATLDSLRVAWGALHGDGFTMQLMHPPTTAPCPVVVTGDACWAYLNDEVIVAAARAGVALAWLNRCEVHADPPPDDRAAIDALLHSPPQGMAAIAAWAWALHRAVDALVDMQGIDASRIAVAGHSRGGKAALLAAALDTRIALVAANNSGTLGAASSHVAGDGSESVPELARRFPHWVGPRLRHAVMRGSRGVRPSIDQHVLLASVAPRRVLVTQARGDAWANPAGTRHAIEQARAMPPDNVDASLRLVEREGSHPQTAGDWLTVVDAARALPCRPG